MANLTGSTTAVFLVRLSTAVDEIVDVDWNTRDGTAIAGQDYEAANGTVSFLPGETEKAIDVVVYGQDDVSANGKKFYIELKPPANAVLTDALAECVITVADEDGVLVTSLVVAQGKRGLKGNPGLSAYEQAVLMGYTGTVEQWMAEIGDAAQAATRAEEALVEVEANAAKAEAAASAASFAGRIFQTAAAGVDPITGVPNGFFYNVRSASGDAYIDEYQNVNGTPTATGKSYPTSSFVQEMAEYVPLPYKNGATYDLYERVTLANGDIVRSIIAGNTNNPNVDMTGWVNVNSASQVVDASGQTQQQINTKLANTILVEPGTGSGKNITVFPEYNAIAPDVSASTISGGGNNLQRNMIGYTESVNVFVGDGVNKTFTTNYDTSNATDIDVWLVRADSVLINVTPFSTLTYVGGKTQVLYPKDGHFVNDAGGTNEGTNPAVLSTQKIRLVRKTKNLIAGSNSSYCGIYGGYDNLQIGIMNHQIGAHLRITGGNHNTQLGGSYNVIETGTYHVQLGGSGHTISGSSGTGVAVLGGGQNTVTGSSGWIIGGQKTLISGARAGALGSWNGTNSGSDSTIGGQSITNSGGGSFVYGQTLTNTGGWVIQAGLQNTNNGNYSFQWGRDNSNTKDYSETGGRYAVGRTAGARTYANGRIASSGDAQTSRIHLKAQTTSATEVFASGANGDQTVNIAENSNNLVFVRAVATDIATDDSASFELKFHVKRKGGVTTIMGTPTPTKIYNDTNASTWNIAANVSSALAMFRIECTGEASKTINWSMSVDVVEVSHA